MLSKYTQARIRKIEITYALTHPEMMTDSIFTFVLFIYDPSPFISYKGHGMGDFFHHCCVSGIYIMMDCTVCCPDHKFRTEVLITQSAQSTGSQIRLSLGMAFNQGKCLFQGHTSFTSTTCRFGDTQAQPTCTNLEQLQRAIPILELPVELVESYNVTASWFTSLCPVLGPELPC